MIWLVLMEDRISPFRSQIRMEVSVKALMMNFPVEEKNSSWVQSSTLRPAKVRVQRFSHLSTCFRNSYVEDGSRVPLRKVLRSSFEGEGAVLLLYHLKDADSVSVCQPGDKCSAAATFASHRLSSNLSIFKLRAAIGLF